MSDDVPESLLPAVELLTDHGFILVEYGQRALPKYGYPIVVSVSHSSLLPILMYRFAEVDNRHWSMLYPMTISNPRRTFLKNMDFPTSRRILSL